MQLDVGSKSKRRGLADVDDDLRRIWLVYRGLVVRIRHGSNPVIELPGEELIPGSETKEGKVWIVFLELLKLYLVLPSLPFAARTFRASLDSHPLLSSKQCCEALLPRRALFDTFSSLLRLVSMCL